MLAALYDQVGDSAFSLAMRIVEKPNLAEKIVAEVFAQIYGEHEVGADLNQSGARVLALVRQRAIVRRHGEQGGTWRQHERAAVEIPELAHGDSRPLLGATQQARLRQALAQLPPTERLAVELIYFEGLTQDELADRINATVDDVRHKVTRGLSVLRDTLQVRS